jgi:hypothetical protein
VNPAGYGEDSTATIDLAKELPQTVEVRTWRCCLRGHLFRSGKLMARYLAILSIHVKEQLSFYHETNNPKYEETDGTN